MPSFTFDPERFKQDRFIPDVTKAREASIESYNRQRERFLKDARETADNGGSPQAFAKRWGIQLASARRRMIRAGETTLAEYFRKDK